MIKIVNKLTTNTSEKINAWLYKDKDKTSRVFVGRSKR